MLKLFTKQNENFSLKIQDKEQKKKVNRGIRAKKQEKKCHKAMHSSKLNKSQRIKQSRQEPTYVQTIKECSMPA